MSDSDTVLLNNFDRAVVQTEEGFYKTLFRLADLARESALPCVVREYDRSTGMAQVQPIVRYSGATKDGEISTPRRLYRVPVATFAHGGFVVDAPLFAGDTGWLIAGDRNSKTARLENSGLRTKAQKETDADYSRGVLADYGAVLSFENGFFIPSAFGGIGLEDADGLVLKKVSEDGKETSIVIKDGELEAIGGIITLRSSGDDGNATLTLGGGEAVLTGTKLTRIVTEDGQRLVEVSETGVVAKNTPANSIIDMDDDAVTVKKGDGATVSVKEKEISASAESEDSGMSIDITDTSVVTESRDGSGKFVVSGEEVTATVGDDSAASVTSTAITAKVGVQTILVDTGKVVASSENDTVTIDTEGLHHDGPVDEKRTIITSVQVSGNRVQMKTSEASVRGDFIVGVGEESDWKNADGVIPTGEGGVGVIEPNRMAVSNSAGTVIGMSPLTDGTLVSADGTGALKSLPMMAGGKWMKTDGNGLPTTTNEVPVAIDGNPGFLYDDSGTLVKVQFGNQADTVAEGNHGHVPADINGLGDAAIMNVGTETGTVAAGDHSHGDEYAEAEHAHLPSDIYYTEPMEKRSFVIIDKGEDTGALCEGIDVADLTAKSSKDAHRYIVLQNDGTAELVNAIPLSHITGDIGEHYGNCLVTIDNDGNLSHSGNKAYDAVAALTDDYDDEKEKLPYLKGEGYAAQKWMKTNEEGEIATTDEVPIALDGTNGIICEKEGAIEKLQIGTVEGTVAAGDHEHENYVTVDTKQTITGAKTFAQNVDVVTAAGTANYAAGAINLKRADGKPFISFFESATATASKGYIQLTAAGTLVVGSRNGGIGVMISSAANEARLENAPTVKTTETTSKAIATCGWCNTNLATSYDMEKLKLLFVLDSTEKPERLKSSALPKCEAVNCILVSDGSGYVKTLAHLDGNKWMKTDASGLPSVTNDTPVVVTATSNGVLFATAGAISYKPIGTAAGTVAAGNHTHSNYAASNHTHSSLSMANGSSGKRYVAYTNGAKTTSLVQIYATELTATASSDRRYVQFAAGAEKASLTDKIPLEDIDGSGISGHSGNCLVVVDDAGQLTHSTNKMFNIVDQVKDLDDADKNFGGALQEIVEDYKKGPKGDSSSKGLPYLKQSGAPASTTAINPSGVSPDTTAWTAGDRGLSITQVTRVKWDESAGKFYKYERTFTYTKMGVLYSVSGETRTEVDTPTVISWR